MKKLILVFEGPVGSDCCSHNIYKPSEPMTVKELCDDIIKNTKAWGYIGIKDNFHVFGNPNVEYLDGQYVNKQRKPIRNFKFPSKIANAYIEQIDWEGGWSRSDWLITIKEN